MAAWSRRQTASQRSSSFAKAEGKPFATSAGALERDIE
jgi:hypothetical protein